mmetsp:Transcript_6553/g.13174  ORF Transcript_6553/g.13174 Transcript_6553/m.13174 type:complete len:205 (+) Transcript_6553:2624-3238(+)
MTPRKNHWRQLFHSWMADGPLDRVCLSSNFQRATMTSLTKMIVLIWTPMHHHQLRNGKMRSRIQLNPRTVYRRLPTSSFHDLSPAPSAVSYPRGSLIVPRDLRMMKMKKTMKRRIHFPSPRHVQTPSLPVARSHHPSSSCYPSPPGSPRHHSPLPFSFSSLVNLVASILTSSEAYSFPLTLTPHGPTPSEPCPSLAPSKTHVPC